MAAQFERFDPCIPHHAVPANRTRFPGTEKPSQFRSDSAAQRGLRTEFRPFSRVLRLKSPASLSPQNSVSWTLEMERPEPRLRVCHIEGGRRICSAREAEVGRMADLRA